MTRFDAPARGSPARVRCAAIVLLMISAMAMSACRSGGPEAGTAPVDPEPFILVLGIAQDGGVPQAGSFKDPAWTDASRRRCVVCLGLVDPGSGRRWMFEATPDFPAQLQRLHDASAPSPAERPGLPLDGIFLTHAHMGHYTGLMFLGHESMGARGVPVYVMPRMRSFLETNGPWSQLVRLRNIELRPLEVGQSVALGEHLSVTPMLVPHRQEFSEVVGFRIQGPRRSVLFIPDIDAWSQWDAAGTRLEDELARVDVAYLDGTFFSPDELPGRDMSTFPHPLITQTMARLAPLSAAERAKVRFIHLNHTNPALDATGPARRSIRQGGFRVAEEMERFGL